MNFRHLLGCDTIDAETLPKEDYGLKSDSFCNM